MQERGAVFDRGQLAIDLAQSQVGLAALKCTGRSSRRKFDTREIRQARLLREYYQRLLKWDSDAHTSPKTEAADDFQRALREVAGLFREQKTHLTSEQRQTIKKFVALLELFIQNALTARDAGRLIDLLNRLSPLSGFSNDALER